jgi:hypothetical protein
MPSVLPPPSYTASCDTRKATLPRDVGTRIPNPSGDPVRLFGTLKDNMNGLDFSLLLPDVMTIADEVDAQLTQTRGSYMKLPNSPKASKLAISAKEPAA